MSFITETIPSHDILSHLDFKTVQIENVLKERNFNVDATLEYLVRKQSACVKRP